MNVLFGNNSRYNISLGLGERIINSRVKSVSSNNKIAQNNYQIITSDAYG